MRRVITPHLLISTPFAEKCDGNRLQIAASQSRQALPLAYSEPAYVVTGFERNPMPDRVLVEKSAQVKFVSSKALVLYYPEEDEYEIIEVNSDDKVYVQEGQSIVPGDVIKSKEHFFHGEELTQGVNLVCAVMSHPLSFEDAIVLSKSAAKKLEAFKYRNIELFLEKNEVLLSRVPNRYEPLPEIGETIKKDEPIVIVGNKFIFSKPKKSITDKRSIVKDITIVLGPRYKSDIREHYLTLKYLVSSLEYRIESLDLPDEIKQRLRDIHFIFEKLNQKIEGINSESAYIKISLKDRYVLSKGDKLTNRHAAKGVVGYIVEDEEMPILSDGRRAEIIINPMSIISRMNTSQLFEIAANRALYNFKQKLKRMAKEGSTIDEMYEFIKAFYSRVSSNSSWIYEGIIEKLEEMKDTITPEELALTDWRFIAPAFESCSSDDILDLLEMVSDPLYIIKEITTLNLEDSIYIQEEVDKTPDVIERLKEIYRHTPQRLEHALQNDYKIYKVNPIVDVVFYDDQYCLISADYMYFTRLSHIAEDKISARSMESYDLSGQPTTGKRKTAQRFGEMEVWNLVAYNALPILNEFLNEKSDSFSRKLEFIYSVLTGNDLVLSNDRFDQESLKIFKVFLYQVGLKLNTSNYYNIDFMLEKLKGRLDHGNSGNKS